jgi:hypothetical protein
MKVILSRLQYTYVSSIQLMQQHAQFKYDINYTVTVTTDGVWFGEFISWLLTGRIYK